VAAAACAAAASRSAAAACSCCCVAASASLLLCASLPDDAGDALAANVSSAGMAAARATVRRGCRKVPAAGMTQLQHVPTPAHTHAPSTHTCDALVLQARLRQQLQRELLQLLPALAADAGRHGRCPDRPLCVCFAVGAWLWVRAGPCMRSTGALLQRLNCLTTHAWAQQLHRWPGRGAHAQRRRKVACTPGCKRVAVGPTGPQRVVPALPRATHLLRAGRRGVCHGLNLAGRCCWAVGAHMACGQPGSRCVRVCTAGRLRVRAACGAVGGR
jgi:hypothetical protein